VRGSGARMVIGNRCFMGIESRSSLIMFIVWLSSYLHFTALILRQSIDFDHLKSDFDNILM
jgi:hypothetical protein